VQVVDMVQCAKCGMQNADGSKYCRFCGDALLSASSNDPRRPYSWQSEEFKVNDRTQNYQSKDTRVFAPPTQPQPQMVQPLQQHQQAQSHQPHQQMQPAPFYGQQQPQHFSYGHRYCPNCHTQVMARMVRKIAPAGWVVFAVLLVGFFPLFWIGFLIKEDRQICPICGTRLG
jgi:RNA polymerase subunit RPABC4/transcription elongation factor Spt4